MTDYFDQLREQVERVFASHPDRPNHLEEFPWLVGALGNPDSKIWFVAENPSLTMVKRANTPDGSPPTLEAQWSASRGDRLFRDMLVKYGFKDGEWNSSGGWQCYITDVIKEADYVNRWRATSKRARYAVADIWAGVLKWELEQTQPVLVVTMGQQVESLINWLSREKRMAFPARMAIAHYSYIALRPRGKQGPMHPERVAEYDAQFAQVAARYRDLMT